MRLTGPGRPALGLVWLSSGEGVGLGGSGHKTGNIPQCSGASTALVLWAWGKHSRTLAFWQRVIRTEWWLCVRWLHRLLCP